ncbi:MAG: DUF4234 domain-containing protein [Candidatus Cloacimonetes bacterium]|nr:DUF4234 domain-containing protein [Candidatus Cloacimonadota bacterium]
MDNPNLQDTFSPTVNDTTELTEVEDLKIYHPISISKFIILNLVTFGLYSIVWAYRCWQNLPDPEDKVRPFWRALFSHLFYFALYKRIYKGKHQGLGAIIFVCYLVSTMSYKLPEPYDIVSLFSFLFLIPILSEVNRQNLKQTITQNSSYSFKHFFTIIIGGGLLFLYVCSLFLFAPSTQVIKGSRLDSNQLSFLHTNNFLLKGDKVHYFYTDAIFSIQEEGNFFTDKTVVSYIESETPGEYLSNVIPYQEITDLSFESSDNFIENSIIKVSLQDDTFFEIGISNELGLDKTYFNKLQSLWTNHTHSRKQ